MSAATDGAAILMDAATVLGERDAVYQSSDALYADLMELMFPNGVELRTKDDHHRFHLFMLLMVKVTRYARNWEKGHLDSLIDTACYAGMLASLDPEKRKATPPGS